MCYRFKLKLCCPGHILISHEGLQQLAAMGKRFASRFRKLVAPAYFSAIYPTDATYVGLQTTTKLCTTTMRQISIYCTKIGTPVLRSPELERVRSHSSPASCHRQLPSSTPSARTVSTHPCSVSLRFARPIRL